MRSPDARRAAPHPPTGPCPWSEIAPQERAETRSPGPRVLPRDKGAIGIHRLEIWRPGNPTGSPGRTETHDPQVSGHSASPGPSRGRREPRPPSPCGGIRPPGLVEHHERPPASAGPGPTPAGLVTSTFGSQVLTTVSRNPMGSNSLLQGRGPKALCPSQAAGMRPMRGREEDMQQLSCRPLSGSASKSPSVVDTVNLIWSAESSNHHVHLDSAFSRSLRISPKRREVSRSSGQGSHSGVDVASGIHQVR